MSKYTIDGQTLTDIADAIRGQTGDENPIAVSDYAAQIANIQGGGSHVELTQAEYDELTDAEKNNGSVYFITDTNGNGEDFQPVIYSLEEREVGVWTDGKPLYERTHHIVPSSPIQPQTETTLNLPDMTDADKYFYVGVIGGYKGTEQDVAHWAQFTFEGNRSDASAVCVRQSTASSLVVWTGSNSGYFPQVSTDNRICEFYITIRYTKTSDTAGSGIWTPQGVPAVHYSADEHVIGTWVDGSTLYEKTVFDTFTSGSTRLDIPFGIGSNNFSIISVEGVFFQLGSPLSSPFNTATPSEASYSVKSIEGYSLYADNGIRIERQNAQAYGSTPTVYVTIRYIKAST